MTESKSLKCEFLNDNDTEELMKHYSGPQLGWCQVGANKTLMTHAYSVHGDSIWRAKVRPSDRWIVTFARSGTTWVQELVWLLNNDLDYEKAARNRITDRYYFPEFDSLNNNLAVTDGDDENTTSDEGVRNAGKSLLTGEILESMASPRFIKTHLTFEMLPPDLLDAGCKVMYVARNPKDVIVSYYHMKTSRKHLRYTGDFRSFWNFFRRDLKLGCPYWSHVKQAWNLRNHPNLLFIFYEDMKMDLPGVIRKAANFYDRPCTDDEIAKLARHLDFENFKSNPMIGSRQIDGHDIVNKDMFVRKGQVGGWRELFTPDLEAEADRWIEKNLRDTDLRFPHLNDI